MRRPWHLVRVEPIGAIDDGRYKLGSCVRRRLLEGLTELWEAALDERRASASRSPVTAVDRLLVARQGGVEE